MPRNIPINDDFPRGFHEALAKVVIEFGRIEYVMKLCIKDLRGESFDDGMAAAQRAAGRFHHLCENLLTAGKAKLTTDEFDSLVEFVETAKGLAPYRHDSVHAYWTMENGSIMRIRPYWDRDKEKLVWDRSRSVTVQELEKKAAEMRRLHEVFNPVRLNWSVRQLKRD